MKAGLGFLPVHRPSIGQPVLISSSKTAGLFPKTISFLESGEYGKRVFNIYGY